MEKAKIPSLPSDLTRAEVNQVVHELIAKGKVTVKPGCEAQLTKSIGEISPSEARQQYRAMALELDARYGETKPRTATEALNNIVELSKADAKMSRFSRLTKGIPD